MKTVPGLVWRARANGRVAYWCARADLVKAGYRPPTVRLHYAENDPALVQRCHDLQNEMLEWSRSRGFGPVQHYDGTFVSLVRFCETHPESPFHDLTQATQRNYSVCMNLLMRAKGARRVDAVDGSTIRGWYKELCKAHSTSWAYYTITVLKSHLSFAATKRIEEAKILREELRCARFSMGQRRKEYLTYEQVVAFRNAAHDMGHHWMALCLTLQFELGLRRRDVIGQWVTKDGTDGIRVGGRMWRDGLTWADINATGELRRTVSKTRNTSAAVAIHQISDYPDLVAELARIPADRRVGPIVLYNGLPPTEQRCRYLFRLIARRAGIPDTVWNMDARAGANTEARNAGATREETMALLTHSQEDTNEGYMREHTKLSRSAAQKRLAARQKVS